MGGLLDDLEWGAFFAESTQHEMVINVGIGEKVRGVDVLR